MRVVLDPCLMLAVDVFPCEDGHAQERSLFGEVLPTVEEDDVWIADRNFCTLKFLFGIAAQKGYFIIRQHQSMPWQATDDFELVGQSDSGTVFEQNIILSADDGQLLKARRVKVCLEQPNRDGDREIFILTNLSSEVINALLIAQLYRKRWKLETLFQVLTENLCCEHCLWKAQRSLTGGGYAIAKFSVSQYTYQNKEQYFNWLDDLEKSKKKYGQSLETWL